MFVCWAGKVHDLMIVVELSGDGDPIIVLADARVVAELGDTKLWSPKYVVLFVDDGAHGVADNVCPLIVLVSVDDLL